ncbi:hypothetical protein HB662_02800 [Roseomonas frigidaquae]|uniref:DUF922 domain-containing protein n=1 Tax=Falsiroseomonas frigidaquae TaxID=487318 RepID=A0ABX1EUT8_9PROT|nr:hypothetical protein [Falsiroseomonas frigidaquae]NKE43689.1 hypothetical protein [Falsiroseomonas frigidaquae]
MPPPVPAPVACPPRGAPLVRVTVSDPDPRVLAPVSAEDLRRLADLPEESTPGTVLHHLGLTMSRVEWRSEITVRSQGPDAGPVCGVPSEVRLSLVHAEHSIRLAREIPRGGCLARQVLAHERRHAEVNRRTLRDAADGLRQAARAWAARARAEAPDAGAAALQLQEDLTAAVEPVLARLREAREAGHDAIDTPQEYRRLGRVCPTDQRRLSTRLQSH